jgi:predicted PurR-regulated permease PerM
MRMAPFALALLLLPFAGRLRRAGRGFNRVMYVALLLVASLATVGGIAACGGAGNSAAQPQTYNLTITVTAGSLSNTFNATLTVG